MHNRVARRPVCGLQHPAHTGLRLLHSGIPTAIARLQLCAPAFQVRCAVRLCSCNQPDKQQAGTMTGRMTECLAATCRFADLAVVAANISLFKNYTQPCAVDTYAEIKVRASASNLHACKRSNIIPSAGAAMAFYPAHSLQALLRLHRSQMCAVASILPAAGQHDQPRCWLQYNRLFCFDSPTASGTNHRPSGSRVWHLQCLPAQRHNPQQVRMLLHASLCICLRRLVMLSSQEEHRRLAGLAQ